MSTLHTTIRIQRSDNTDDTSEKELQFQEYFVNFELGAKLLDALRNIQQDIDPTLSFRWECRCGICGTCALMVNGKPQLSCEAILEPDTTITITPLLGFPVIKDLVVDASPSLERLNHLNPYLVTPVGKLPVVTKVEAERSKPFRRCIECFACVAAVSSGNGTSDRAIDPLGIVKLARFATDPRDTLDRPKLAKSAGIHTFTLKELSAATAVCPKQIDILDAYIELTGQQKAPEEEA